MLQYCISNPSSNKEVHRQPRTMANATDRAVHANQPYMTTNSSTYTVLQASIMTSQMGSTAADSDEHAHQYFTKHKAGRPEQGEKAINGAVPQQQQHQPAKHRNLQQQHGQLVWGSHTTPNPPTLQHPQQLRTAHQARNNRGGLQWPAMLQAVMQYHWQCLPVRCCGRSECTLPLPHLL